MNQRNSTIELCVSFQPEIRLGRVAGKSFKKSRYRRNCFLIRFILMVKKYILENLKHTVKNNWPKKLKSIHSQTITTNNRKHFRFHIKQYWRFHWVISKQYFTLFQTSNNTWIFRELLVNNTTHFSSLYQPILRFSESSFQIKL